MFFSFLRSNSSVFVLSFLSPKFMSMFYAAEVDGQYMCFTETSDLPTFRSIAAMNPTSRSAKAMRRAASRNQMIAGENLTRKF